MSVLSGFSVTYKITTMNEKKIVIRLFVYEKLIIR